MDHERSTLIQLAVKLLYVYSAQCRYCSTTFDYAVERADTDMLSCYCGSVYSIVAKQLVVAPITGEEYHYGLAGDFDKRINTVCPNRDYRYYRTKVCPFCGKSGIQDLGRACSIKEYCVLHPNTLIVYNDGAVKPLKEEIDASHL